jgi:predicted transcriptional regulator
MHKMSATMHKNPRLKMLMDRRYHTNANTNTKKEYHEVRKKKGSNYTTTIKSNLATKITVLDIEKENRLSKVISLYSKGLNQEEIAQELHVDQSTVSRDLRFIKHEARKQIERYLREDILFEYMRYMAGSNEITRKLWQIVENESATTKEKTNALSILMQSYNSRLQTLTAGPESYMNIRKSLSEIDLQRLVDSEPFLKAQVEQRKLFPKGLHNFK